MEIKDLKKLKSLLEQFKDETVAYKDETEQMIQYVKSAIAKKNFGY